MIKLDLYNMKIPFSRVTQSLASWAVVWRFLQSLKVNDEMDFYQGLDERATRHINPACYRTQPTGENHDAKQNIDGSNDNHFNSQLTALCTERLQRNTCFNEVPNHYRATVKTTSPEVTSVLVEIGPGGESGRHKHPVSPQIYVLQGEVTIEFDDRKQQSFSPGEAFMEAVNI